MVVEEIVKKVHDDFKTLVEELERTRENPMVLRVVKNLVKLTNLDAAVLEQDAADEAAAATDPTATDAQQGESGASTESKFSKSPEDCPHSVLTLYGRCEHCGTCLHSNVKNGWCLTCDAEVPPPESESQV